MIVAKNRYLFKEVLGQGGMGVVHRVFDMDTQQYVAIKTLCRPCSSQKVDAQTYQRFVQEIEILQSLCHENILEVLDVWTQNGVPYMVMPLLQGHPLSYYLAHEPLSYPDALDIAVQILRGLAAVHKKNVVHRDIKPENIFILKQEKSNRYLVKILDFGVSKVLNKVNTVTRKTTTGISIGTEQYMAPEQYLPNSPITQSADVYSVGLVLYRLFTGQNPFELTHGGAINPFTPIQFALLRKYNSNVSRGVQKTVLKALNRDAKHRFADATQFLNALNRVEKASLSPTRIQRNTQTTLLRIPKMPI